MSKDSENENRSPTNQFYTNGDFVDDEILEEFEWLQDSPEAGMLAQAVNLDDVASIVNGLDAINAAVGHPTHGEDDLERDQTAFPVLDSLDGDELEVPQRTVDEVREQTSYESFPTHRKALTFEVISRVQ